VDGSLRRAAYFGDSLQHQLAELAKEYAAVEKSTTLPIVQPTTSSHDVLTEVLRDGAKRLLAEAIQAEVADWIESHSHIKDLTGHRQVVRNGYLPERTIQTGLGDILIQQPRVHDRRCASERIKFTSSILPPYLKRTKSLDELLPWLYLKGVSTSDFSEALAALLGADAPGLSATTVTRLKAAWELEYDAWSKRSLKGKHYVYIWADGVHFNIRLEQDRQCILVLMGATEDGKKELIAIADGYRESEQSWKELLLGVKARGLEVAPSLAVGDGALGFWKAIRQIWPTTQEQRCWVHKTANVLDKLPKGMQSKAKAALHEIYEAETKADAEKAFDLFAKTHEAKYPKAVECLVKDRGSLLTFYDFPAEHWRHIRTTNPIESTFATVRLRTVKTKGSGSRTACLTMVFKLMESASKNWRLLNGSSHLKAVISGTKFVDGIEVNDAA
jgi:putative transposase